MYARFAFAQCVLRTPLPNLPKFIAILLLMLLNLAAWTTLAAPSADALRTAAALEQAQVEIAAADGGDDPIQRIETRLRAMKLALAAGLPDQVLLLVERALPLARIIDDPLLLARVQVRHAQAVSRQGVDLSRALPPVQELLRIIRDPKSPVEMRALLPEIQYIHAIALVAAGDLAQADVELKSLVQAQPRPLRTLEDVVQQLRLLDAQARLRMVRGDSAGALFACDQAAGLLASAPALRGQLMELLQLRGLVMLSRNDVDAALQVLESAKKLTDAAVAADRPRRLGLFTALAKAQLAVGRGNDAVTSQRQALELSIELRGADALPSQLLRITLAQLLSATGQAAEAKVAIDAVLAEFSRKATDPIWLAEAESVKSRVLAQLRQFEPALKTSQHAAALWQTALGSSFGDLEFEYTFQADMLALLQRWPAAVDAQGLAMALQLRRVGTGLAAGGENERKRLTNMMFPATNRAVLWATRAQTASPQAAQIAAAAVLNARARVLDALSATARSIRQLTTAEDRQLLAQLRQARTEMAGLVLVPRPPGDADALRRWRAVDDKLAQLEAEASRRVPHLQGELGPVSVAAVQRALPTDAALVEFWTVEGQTDQANATIPAQLTAMVLLPQGPPRWFALGDAAASDALARAWSERLRDPRRADVHEAGEQLARRVWLPLMPSLQGRKRLFIVADGPLSQLPLGALRQKDGRFVAEQWQLVELTSGRDLLRVGSGPAARGPALVLADPTFAPELGLPPLPGARQEGQEVAVLLGADATLLTGDAATRQALERVSGPRVLHLATHGWYDPSQVVKHPLAASGLMLAASAKVPGRITALDIAALDLFGTDLVTLSACETGRGVAMGPEGAYGLRRALVLAGARTALISLGKVDDQATLQLMVGFYKLLSQGVYRGAALQQAQLSLLQQRRQRQGVSGPARGAEALDRSPSADVELADHPYWWAAFVLQGDGG